MEVLYCRRRLERWGQLQKGKEWRDNQAERSINKSGKVVGAAFLGANLMGFLPEGRVAKVHPAKTSCLTRVQVWKGPIIPGLGVCLRVSLGGGISNVNVRNCCVSKGSFCLWRLWLIFWAVSFLKCVSKLGNTLNASVSLRKTWKHEGTYWFSSFFKIITKFFKTCKN